MRNAAWMSLLALVAMACTPTRPDNGDLGAAKGKDEVTVDAHGAGKGQDSTDDERPAFVWMTGSGLNAFEVVELGHGTSIRFATAQSSEKLVELIAKKLQTGPIVVQARTSTVIPAGTYKWYEVSRSNALIIVCNPIPTANNAPDVHAHERVVYDPGLGEHLLHKELDGSFNEQQLAQRFVKIVESTDEFLNKHAASPDIKWDDGTGTGLVAVSALTVIWPPGRTITLSAWLLPGRTNYSVCAVGSGDGKAQAAGPGTVNVSFNTRDLMIKMY